MTEIQLEAAYNTFMELLPKEGLALYSSDGTGENIKRVLKAAFEAASNAGPQTSNEKWN